MDILFLIIAVAGIAVALIVGYLQLIVPFVKKEVKLSGKFPFVVRTQPSSDTETVRIRRKPVAKGTKSIVVLPFSNLGKTDDDYFTAGVAEEITSRLAVIKELAVISRTSANRYANTKKTISEIGEELCVDYVLEGTVRWARTRTGSDRVRITPQLIRVCDDTHIWTDIYDRNVEDIFEIQTDIARRIVEQLDINLGAKERAAVEAKLTDSIDAYHAYLRARYFATRPHFSVENWLKVIECAQQAVQIDPNFVSAYVELSKAHSLMYYFWYDHSEERLNEAKHTANKALEIAPSSPQIHIALAHYYLFCYRDTERALQEIEIAEQGLPDDEDVLTTKASICQIQGRWDDALEVYKKAFALSPRDSSLPTEISGIYWVTRRYKEAMDWCEEAMVLAPEDAWPYLYKVFINWFWKGDTESARAVLEKMPKGHAWEPWVWFWQEMYQGNYQAGIKRLDVTADEWIKIKVHALPKILLAGLAYEYDGNLDEAQNKFKRAKIMLESEVQKHPDDPRYHSSLGIAYAGLGQKEKAIAEGKIAVELLPVSKDAFYGIPYLEDLAHIYALAGESKAALEQLDHLLSIPSWISVPWIKIDPRWRKLRDLRLYKKVMDKHRKDY